MLQPNLSAIQSHLDFLFSGHTQGKIEIAYTEAEGRAVNRARFFDATDTKGAALFAFETNKTQGVNVYVGAALRNPNIAPFGRSSLADFYTATALWCDLDDAGAAKRAKDKYKDLAPSFVVVTGRSPDLRAQIWWKLDAPQSDHAKVKTALDAVCKNLNGDPAVVDPIRIMRLGGTVAWPKKEGRILEQTEIKTPKDATPNVTLDVFTSHFPLPEPVLTPKLNIGSGGVGLQSSALNLNRVTIDEARLHLSHIDPDLSYQDWIAVGMALQHEGLGFHLWDEWSQRGAKYDPHVMRAHWKSFKTGHGITYGTVMHLAKQDGFQRAYNPITTYQAQTPTQTQATQEEQFDPETGEVIEQPRVAPQGAKVLPLVYASDITPVTDTRDFVEGLLSDNEFSVIYGQSNCGKTFFMLDLAMHVALGLPWRDRQVEQGGVIYAALEGGHGTKNRIVAFKQHFNVTQDIPLAVIPSSINFLDDRGDLPAFLQAITEAKTRLGNVRLIVIDTLARAISGGDENSSIDMGKLVIHADAVRQLTGAHIAFVHHSGKDEARGARGHSSLRAAVDTEIEISRPDTDSPSTIKVVKQREMEMLDDMAFSLSRVVLGINRRGKEVTSCVVVPQEVVEVKRDVTLTPVQQFIYEALVDAIIQYGKERAVHRDMPAVKCVDYDELRVVMEARGSKEFFATEKKTTAEQIKSTTFNARTALQRKGKINMNKGYIWLV